MAAEAVSAASLDRRNVRDPPGITKAADKGMEKYVKRGKECADGAWSEHANSSVCHHPLKPWPSRTPSPQFENNDDAEDLRRKKSQTIAANEPSIGRSDIAVSIVHARAVGPLAVVGNVDFLCYFSFSLFSARYVSVCGCKDVSGCIRERTRD